MKESTRDNKSNEGQAENQQDHKVAVVTPGRKRQQRILLAIFSILLIAAVVVVSVLVPPDHEDGDDDVDGSVDDLTEEWKTCYKL